MQLYLAQAIKDYQNAQVIGIFSSKDRAQEALDKYRKDNSDAFTWLIIDFIDQIELDKPLIRARQKIKPEPIYPEGPLRPVPE